jgi:AAA family ATP:ADP antiporter
MTTALSEQEPKTWGQRLLAPIADVRRHEVPSVMLMTLVMFLILAAYYQLKTAREVFILSEGGAEVKSYSSAGQAALLLFLVPAYGAFASRVNRVQLVQWVTIFFVSNIVLFLLAVGAGMRIGIAYFLWVGIFNLMVIAQFWAFATDLYTPEQGKRLFPLLGVGASLGAWVGSVRAGYLMSMGPRRLMVGAAVILMVCALLVRVVNRVTQRDATAKAKPSDDQPLAAGNGFAMILADR